MADNKQQDKKDVFISYGREPDVILFVKQLKSDLEVKGFSVWLDTEDIKPGNDWRADITIGVDRCSIFVPIITQKYVSSRNCVNELYEADNDQKVILPVIYSDVDFTVNDTAKGVKFVVSSINWIMCRPGRDDYGQCVEKIVDIIREKVYGMKVSTPEADDGGTAIHGITGQIDRVMITSPTPNTTPCIPQSMQPIKTIIGVKNANGVAVSHDGLILVTMMQESEVWVFDGETCEKIRTIGGQGIGPGKFFTPWGITIDHDNHVLITCSALECVQKFTVEGKFLKSVGKPGSGEFEFQGPNAIAVNKEGRIYVSDLGNNRIQMLGPDMEYHGCFSLTDPEYGSGMLNNPNGIAIDSNDNVFVADMLNHCIQVFSPEGRYITRIGKQGNIGGCLQTPMAVVIDGDDNVYVGDGMSRVSVFNTSAGGFVRHFGSSGVERGKFGVIRGLCIDVRKRLYVCEWQTNRIQIFQ